MSVCAVCLSGAEKFSSRHLEHIALELALPDQPIIIRLAMLILER